MQYLPIVSGVLVAVVGLIGAGALRNVNQRALVVALQETAEGWRASHDQLKASRESDLARIAELDRRMKSVEQSEKQYRELNLDLQLRIADRDQRIAVLEAELATLKAQMRAFETDRAQTAPEAVVASKAPRSRGRKAE